MSGFVFTKYDDWKNENGKWKKKNMNFITAFLKLR